MVFNGQKKTTNAKKNIELKLIEPKYNININKDYKFQSKTFKKYKNWDFKEYVLVIKQFPSGYFDLVSVDGRARPACLEGALEKIKRNGFLLLDNSDRPIYQKAIKKLKKFKSMTLSGFTPYSLNSNKTTIWRIT